MVLYVLWALIHLNGSLLIMPLLLVVHPLDTHSLKLHHPTLEVVYALAGAKSVGIYPTNGPDATHYIIGITLITNQLFANKSGLCENYRAL
jgi:hypothetical protein